MPKEKPSKGLPETEYIEVYNPGNSILNLSGSKLVIGFDSVELPEKYLMPNEYRLLCPSRFADQFKSHTIGIPSFPSIHNSAQDIRILNDEDRIIFQIEFKAGWFFQGIEGGISLEMIDIQNPCGGAGNWELSKNTSGGTPGNINSVSGINRDNLRPTMENVSAINAHEVLIRFSEPMSSNSLIAKNFSINDKNIIEQFQINDLQRIICILNDSLYPNKMYSLKARNTTDCAGNIIVNEKSDIFAIPGAADSSDIVINEVLFNPMPGGVDYIEIFNNSDKFIDLDHWGFSNKIFYDSNQISYCSQIPYIIKPGSFLAFTIDKERTINDYPKGDAENITEVDKMPGMNNDSGSIYLFSGEGKVIDAFTYNQNYHLILLNDFEGVSLERIDPSGASNDARNWHSASEESGFGTPGKKNSSSNPDTILAGHIIIDPKVISADHSGISDYANIIYSFEKPGFIANVRIFNINGIQVRYLADNVSLSTSGKFIWDGRYENGARAGTGYYIVSFEVYNLDGTHKTYIDKVALGTHF